MKKLLHYIKPYWFWVIIVIGLTFAQVQFELALPDYMSDIVTNGIQYGGVKDNTPLALRAKEMEHLLIFSEEDEKILNNYTLIKADKEVYVSNQLVRFDEDIYVLNSEHDDLNEILLRPIVYVSLIDSGMIPDIDKDQLYDLLKTDASLLKEVKTEIDEMIKGYEDNLEGTAILFVQNEYKAIGMNTTTIQTNYILHVGLVMLGVSLLSVLCQISSTYLSTKIAAKVAAKIRGDVFRRVETFSSAEMSHFSTSSLITRTTNDITQIQMLTQMCLRIVLMAPMMGITSIFKVMRYPNLIWLLLTAMALIALVMILMLVVAMPRFKIIQSLIDKLNNVMRELLDGMLVIRAFNSEKAEEKRFDDSNKTLSKTLLFVDRSMGIMMPFMTFLMNVLTIAIIWFAAHEIDINAMQVGDLMAFIQYTMHVMMSFMIVAMIWVMIPRTLVSAKRVFEVIDTKDIITDKDEVKMLPLENGDLVFDDVSFRYPGAEDAVLEHISFKASPKEVVAFIGSTGSGKSTLIKLIPRLYDVSEGAITYSGIDIRDVAQKDLREHIGYVPQKAVLFSGDIESNIKFGREVDNKTLNEAIDISQSRNIINEKDEGLSSKITQGGSNVSGGQKQRLSIARALAKDANIYIFDDSFSALDYATDKKLRAELSEMIKKKNATVFIVAQRISTIKNADKIIVLDSGKMAGMGRHEELLKTCEVYQEIARSQLSEEELANA